MTLNDMTCHIENFEYHVMSCHTGMSFTKFTCDHPIFSINSIEDQFESKPN